MTFTYDKDANALYVKLSDNMIVETMTLGKNVYLDIDSDNKAVGISSIVRRTGCKDIMGFTEFSSEWQ